MKGDDEYIRGRAAQERFAAARATNGRAKKAHAELAESYERLISERAKRIPVSYPAVVTTSDGNEQAVTITDISAEGFRMEGGFGLSAGEHIYLRVGKQGNIAAEIKWVDGGAAGGVLNGPPKL